MTPTASAAVDTKKGSILDVHAMDDNDEPRLSETDHRESRNKEFKSGTYRGMLCGIVLRDSPKQVGSLVKATSVPANMREFLSWAQRHYRIDVTASTVERKNRRTDICWSVSRWVHKFLHTKVRVLVSFESRAKCVVPFEVKKRHPPQQDPASRSHRHTDHRGSNAHTRKTYCVDCGTYIDSVPREIYDILEARRSASSIRDGEIAKRGLKDKTITKRQLDFATRMMLEQVLCQSEGDYNQSAMVQLFMDCVDLATEPFTACVTFRERPMHFDDNQTLSWRVVDPLAEDGVWAIMDDGCNGCCHGEVWRQHAEAKMEVFGPSSYLAAQQGDYLQWRWNEHDEWKVEKSHGHTFAGI